MHPFGLFNVSRLMNADAIYTCFSHNRFILGGRESASSIRFLRSLPAAAVHSLRTLDLKVNDDQFEDGLNLTAPNPPIGMRWFSLSRTTAISHDYTSHWILDG